ncbi:DNA-directed DNA polymerase [Tanacetum coccineum]
MNERCSTILLKKLPFKEKDPGSFTIPCQVSNLHIDNALADLRASISLMPYTMYEKLGLGELKPTRINLELTDRSIQYPRGVVENVLIKVDKFVLPIDFDILDMPEDSRIPIILGRPFLDIVCSIIDVFSKKITLRVGDDEVILDMDQSMKRPSTEDDEHATLNTILHILNYRPLKMLHY